MCVPVAVAQGACTLRFSPSAKTRPAGGHRLEQWRLGVREWTSPKGGTIHDRDITAARTLEAEDLRVLQQTPAGTGEVRACAGQRTCPVAVLREAHCDQILVRNQGPRGDG